MKPKFMLFNEGDGGTPSGGGGAAISVSEPPAAPDFDTLKGGLSEELRDNPIIQDTKSFDAMAERLINSQKQIGELSSKKGLPVPQEDWKDDDWEAFYKQLPDSVEKAEDFGFEAVEFENGMPYDENMDKAFAQKARELRLTKSQAARMRDWWNETAGASYDGLIQKNETAKGETLAAMESELGGKEAMQNELDDVASLLGKFAPAGRAQDLETELIREGTGNNSVLLHTLINIKNQFQEGSPAGGGSNLGAGGVEQLESKYSEWKSRDEVQKAYLDASHPNHEKVVKENGQWVRKIAEAKKGN